MQVSQTPEDVTHGTGSRLGAAGSPPWFCQPAQPTLGQTPALTQLGVSPDSCLHPGGNPAAQSWLSNATRDVLGYHRQVGMIVRETHFPLETQQELRAKWPTAQSALHNYI